MRFPGSIQPPNTSSRISETTADIFHAYSAYKLDRAYPPSQSQHSTRGYLRQDDGGGAHLFIPITVFLGFGEPLCRDLRHPYERVSVFLSHPLLQCACNSLTVGPCRRRNAEVTCIHLSFAVAAGLSIDLCVQVVRQHIPEPQR
jgi:hypothetical protein